MSPSFRPLWGFALTVSKIEQFIDTLYPRQDPQKLSAEAKKKEAGEPGMDPGEAAVLLGITLLTLFCISAIMVRLLLPAQSATPADIPQIGVAWFFGARFDSLWKGQGGFSWPVGDSASSVASAVPSIEHPEL